MMSAPSSVYFAQISSPLGNMVLAARRDALLGVYFADQRDCPVQPDGVADSHRIHDPTQGQFQGVDLRHVRAVRLAQADLLAQTAQPDWGELNDAGLPTNFPDWSEFPASVQEIFSQTTAQLRAWLGGQRTQFDLPLHLDGTVFQVKVWRALQAIPYGQLLSYAQVAQQVSGSSKGSRAVGVAVGKNPLSIIIPCHRVVASNGRLTGYGGGLHRKCRLLMHEGLALV